MTKKRGAKPIVIYCSVCNRPHPNKARPNKIKGYFLICPDCDVKEIPKEPWEWYFYAKQLGGWGLVRIAIPDQDALDGKERAKRIKAAMIEKLHLNDLN